MTRPAAFFVSFLFALQSLCMALPVDEYSFAGRLSRRGRVHVPIARRESSNQRPLRRRDGQVGAIGLGDNIDL